MPAKSVLQAAQAEVEVPPELVVQARRGKPEDPTCAVSAALPAQPEAQFETQTLVLATIFHVSEFLPAQNTPQRC